MLIIVSVMALMVSVMALTVSVMALIVCCTQVASLISWTQTPKTPQCLSTHLSQAVTHLLTLTQQMPHLHLHMTKLCSRYSSMPLCLNLIPMQPLHLVRQHVPLRAAALEARAPVARRGWGREQQLAWAQQQVHQVAAWKPSTGALKKLYRFRQV